MAVTGYETLKTLVSDSVSVHNASTDLLVHQQFPVSNHVF